jgi:hypothetical protein|tara:strand:+ start:420 stop:1070 length:651 start_codon:yes stop_codon:yes gene_type:complete
VAGTEPREVAGLGRPETPAEKNERVTKARAERRARQTTRNLVWSLLSSLGIVALLIIVVVRPDANLIESVDYQAVAKEISSEVPSEPITPQLSELWSANRAEISREPGAEITWSIGLLGPESSYVFIDQGFEADASWVSLRTERSASTGEVTFGYGADSTLSWEEYDRSEADPGANNAYVIVYEDSSSTIIIGGTSKRAVSEVADEVSYQLSRGRS